MDLIGRQQASAKVHYADGCASDREWPLQRREREEGGAGRGGGRKGSGTKREWSQKWGEGDEGREKERKLIAFLIKKRSINLTEMNGMR